MSTLKYPVNITALQNTFIIIESYRVLSVNTQATDDKEMKKNLENIFLLPMPESGNQEYFVSKWDMIDTSLAQAAGGQVGQSVAKIAQGAADQAGIGQLLKLKGGYNIDPNTMPLFDGIDHRNFNMTWNFYPRSREDSEELIKIIEALRLAVLPGENKMSIAGVAVNTLSFPNLFKLRHSVEGGSHTKFNEYGYVCSNFDLQFNGGGTWYQFTNGEPVSMTLTMTFTERRRMTKDLYKGAGR